MADNEARGKTRKATEEYVNEVCSKFLAPHSEFISIECKFTGTEGEGVIRVVDSADEIHFYNITELDLEQICEMVVKIVSGSHISREICERDKRKEASMLFRK